jgi:CubicO group peptidase (beta-lactamase class C family)
MIPAMDLNPAVAARVDEVFADMEGPQHPGAALLVVDHDEIIYRKSYGLADLETQRPITTDTSFYLGSISKPFTALAIMLLAEDGRLSYDDRLSAFFPQLPAWAAEISYAICCITRRGLRIISPSLRAMNSSPAT